jgi:predicted Zn-dependent peptidase
VTEESVRETVGELKRLRTGDITDTELEFARNYLMGVFPATVEAASQLAERIQELELYGLPPDYFDQYRQRIAAVTKEDIARVAQKYVDPDRSVILVVGKASEVREPLQSLGYRVGVFDIEGRPLPQ